MLQPQVFQTECSHRESAWYTDICCIVRRPGLQGFIKHCLSCFFLDVTPTKRTWAQVHLVLQWQVRRTRKARASLIWRIGRSVERYNTFVVLSSSLDSFRQIEVCDASGNCQNEGRDQRYLFPSFNYRTWPRRRTV